MKDYTKEEWIDAFVVLLREESNYSIDYTTGSSMLRCRYFCLSEDPDRQLKHLIFDTNSIEDILNYYFNKIIYIEKLWIYDLKELKLELFLDSMAFKTNQIYKEFFSEFSDFIDGDDELLEKCYNLEDIHMATCLPAFRLPGIRIANITLRTKIINKIEEMRRSAK